MRREKTRAKKGWALERPDLNEWAQVFHIVRGSRSLFYFMFIHMYRSLKGCAFEVPDLNEWAQGFHIVRGSRSLVSCCLHMCMQVFLKGWAPKAGSYVYIHVYTYIYIWNVRMYMHMYIYIY